MFNTLLIVLLSAREGANYVAFVQVCYSSIISSHHIGEVWNVEMEQNWYQHWILWIIHCSLSILTQKFFYLVETQIDVRILTKNSNPTYFKLVGYKWKECCYLMLKKKQENLDRKWKITPYPDNISVNKIGCFC